MTIKLGKNPVDFKKELTVSNIDGASDVLTITYIYRTRRQMAQLFDERIAAAKSAPQAAELPDDQQTVEGNYLDQTKKLAEGVLEVATGWDLDDAFTVENLQQLEDDFPGALVGIQKQYEQAVMEFRVKN